MSDPNCKNCHKAGLAILPVRYAVVPKEMPAKLPGTLKAPGVKGLTLRHHHYALRTLRQGFLYVFFEKRWLAGGDWQSNVIRAYEVYSVAENGTLWRQVSAFAAHAVQQPVCQDTAHHIPASVIAIPQPDKAGTVWIAFSEHRWSSNILADYGQDVALRARRMQKIDPANWISSKQHDDAYETSAKSLQEIIEYAVREPVEILAPASEPPLSKEDGTYLPAPLKRVTTRYPLHRREKQVTATLESMKAIGKHHPEQPPHPPMVLALWDSIGVTHELNGFRNEAAGRIAQYGQERELEISALNAIEGLKQALQQKAEDGQKEFHDTARNSAAATYNPERLRQRRIDAEKLAEPRRSQELETCGILDGWAQRGAPSYYRGRLENANLMPEPRRSQEMAAVRKEVDDFLGRREQNAAHNIEEARAKAWSKYEPKIDASQLNRFKGNQEKFLDAAGKIIDERTDDLLTWLQSKALLDSLTEYHTQYIPDGVAFEDTVGEALLGIVSSPKGAQKLKQWIEENKATETNLVWRAVALNQSLAITDLNQILQEAEQHKGARTLASTLDWTGKIAKTLKSFADIHKKAAGVYNANTTASSKNGSSAFGATIRPINTRNMDYLAMTAGDVIVRHFRIDGLADFASEKLIQHVFSIRAFVEPADSVNLILAQAKNEELARQQTLQRLRAGKRFLAMDQPEVRTVQAEALKSAWADFKAKNTGATNAIKDARLAVLVGLIEGVNFFKLMGDCTRKNDKKSWLSLSASGMTITSALFDVATVPAKGLFGAESWSYQRLKLFGGVLSAGAAFIGAGIDLFDADKALAKKYYGLFALYGFKAVLGGLGGGLTIVTTFTYSAPLISRLTGNAALGTAVRAVGTRAAVIVGARILFMSVGAWITVGTLTIQVFIWIFTDNELQDWTSQCAFGVKRNRAWNAKAQEEQFQTALKEVGIE